MAEQMKAAVLVGPRRLEVLDIPVPQPGPYNVLVRTTGVGICGTDLHIYGGLANYNRDAAGNPIPLHVQPQILGHEISGVVEEVGREVRDLKAGDRVVLDQCLNCFSRRMEPICEYCASGDSHQCLHCGELGITGLAGGFTQYVSIPAVNAIRLEGGVSRLEAALTETLGCVVHAVEFVERAAARYSFGGERRIRNILILGSGPAGLLFVQYFRNVCHFDGPIFVTDLSPVKLKFAEDFGATALSVSGDDLAGEITERTNGEKIYYLVEATGAGAVFSFIPRLLRKQGTVVLYGHGHEGADLSLLNKLHFLEARLVSPVGASGGFDTDRRPSTYRASMRHLVSGSVRVAPLITHPCDLHTLPRIFSQECSRPDFIKAVLTPS